MKQFTYGILFAICLILDVLAFRKIIKYSRLKSKRHTAIAKGKIKQIIKKRTKSGIFIIPSGIVIEYEFQVDKLWFTGENTISRYKYQMLGDLDVEQDVKYSITHPNCSELVCLNLKGRVLKAIIFNIITLGLTALCFILFQDL